MWFKKSKSAKNRVTRAEVECALRDLLAPEVLSTCTTEHSVKDLASKLDALGYPVTLDCLKLLNVTTDTATVALENNRGIIVSCKNESNLVHSFFIQQSTSLLFWLCADVSSYYMADMFILTFKGGYTVLNGKTIERLVFVYK